MNPVQVLRLAERAAFHGAPMDGILVIRDLVRDHDVPDADPWLAWLLGVCQGAGGRYGAAFETLAPIGSGDGDPVIASLASSTLGSLHRQVGQHAVARSFDERALHLARAAHSPGPALVEARLGLAADAVGLHELPLAVSELGAALAALPVPGVSAHGPAPGLAHGLNHGNVPEAWRVRARSCWVRAEVALLHGDAQKALLAARESVRLARAARAPRHEAKGLLFASVAEAGTGRADAATGSALASMRLSVKLGAWPLVWPAGLVLSGMLPDGEQLGQALEVAVLAVDVISEGLPEPLAGQWRRGADVQRLLSRASVPG